MRASAGNLRVRRVGFRAGSDEELTALHAIETPIAAERGSNRMPRSIGGYLRFARNLPSQFHDHAWLVEDPGGTPIASGFCWSNAAGDPRQMACDLFVRRDRRRLGIGSRLLAEICDEAANEDRSLLTWETFDTVPAGDAFSRRVGGSVGRVNRTSELVLADVDWRLIEHWSRAQPARDRGYRLEMVDGVFPDHLRDDAATFHHIMQTAPKEDLDAGDVMIDARLVAEQDRALVESGRVRWTLLVRDADGVCVGGTEVTFEPDDPRTVHQQNTGIDPDHRRIGLAKWVKAVMLERIRRERPEAQTVRTDNAHSNEAMLGINDAIGFGVVSARTEWQADVSSVHRALRSAGPGAPRGGRPAG